MGSPRKDLKGLEGVCYAAVEPGRAYTVGGGLPRR